MNTQISAGPALEPDPRRTSNLWFEVLGPVRAWHDGTELDLGSPQQRAVLAILLLSRGWQVPRDVLIDAIWGDDPPRAAPGTIRTYISRLRRCLDPVTGYRATELITSIGDGYALTPGAVTVDADVFTRYVADAHEARDEADAATAATRLRAALGLWRGMPLAGIQGPYADSQRTRLAELHMAATEDRLAMDIESGGQLAAIAELRTLLNEHPLREKLSELLMLALYRAGRQADALSVFTDARLLLRDELGIDPGPSLRDLHERILRADSSLDSPGALGAPGAAPGTQANGPGRPAGVPAAPERPAQLPPLHADFTGRADTLDAIVTTLKDATDGTVVTITGMPGIGKTALAVHAARAVLDVFPDGQLFAQLGDIAGAPADPAAVLAGFLRALGHGFVPGDLDELIAACRTAFAGRRMLIVLDDADDTAQVNALLPAVGGCVLIVTTQRHLIGLPGVRSFEITGLRPDESLRLLGRVAGQQRLAAEPAAARRLVTTCAGQPMAVRIVGARLATRPGWRVATMVAQLERELISPVRTHPDCSLVEAPFQRAHSRLPDAEAFLFRQAATSDTPEISVTAAAVLMELPECQALTLLESIADSHLIEDGAFGSYRYDPLVKVHAWRMALQIDGPQRCEASRELLRRQARVAAFPSWLPGLAAVEAVGAVAAPVGQ
jgi:DNA-binding SARP family transcriptional activator